MTMEEIAIELDLWQRFALCLLAQEYCPATGICQLCVARKCKLRATEDHQEGSKEEKSLGGGVSSPASENGCIGDKNQTCDRTLAPLCQQVPTRTVA